MTAIKGLRWNSISKMLCDDSGGSSSLLKKFKHGAEYSKRLTAGALKPPVDKSR